MFRDTPLAPKVEVVVFIFHYNGGSKFQRLHVSTPSRFIELVNFGVDHLASMLVEALAWSVHDFIIVKEVP